MSEVIPNILSDIRSLFYDTNVKGSTHSHPYVSIFSILFRTEGLIFESWASRTQTIKLSSDQDTQPNCQGLLEAIQMHLCSIKDVVSGPSSSLSPATLKVATSRLRDIRCLNDQLALELSVENCRLCRVEARALRISSMSYPADLDQLENMSSLASALSGDTPLYAPATRASDISDLEPFDDEKQMKKAGRRITRYLVKYRNSDQRSLLEYKYYGEDYVDGEEGSTIFDRVQHLAAMLYTAKPARLRVLQCIGVFEEPQHCRYGLLHRLPTSAHRQLGPVTLLKYLNSKWKPSLTDRMELARKLAFCMLELHLGGWLHKNFRSENILFFPEETSTRRKLDNPYLIGMECARPDRKDEISEPTTADYEVLMYAHPEYQTTPRPKFSKIYDYYSLGIVLIEIARWIPVCHILERRIQISDKTSVQDTQSIKGILIDEESYENYIGDIAFRMGSIYQRATYTCLKSDFGLSLEQNYSIQDSFNKMVVQELESCVI